MVFESIQQSNEILKKEFTDSDVTNMIIFTKEILENDKINKMLKKIIKKLFPDKNITGINQQTNLIDIFPDKEELDLDYIKFIMEVEKESNIAIPDNTANEFKTYGDIIKYINWQLNKEKKTKNNSNIWGKIGSMKS